MWKRWKAFNRAVADYQSRILLDVMYFTLLAPFAAMVKRSDNSASQPAAPSTFWRARDNDDDGLARARRQF